MSEAGLVTRLERLADHIAGIDSGSGDAALIREAIAALAPPAGSGHPLDDAFRDALVVGLENDSQADDVLRIARPFIQRAFDELARERDAAMLVSEWNATSGAFYARRAEAVRAAEAAERGTEFERPSIADVRAERERSGEGLEPCRERLTMQALERHIRDAETVADLRPALIEMLRLMGHR